MPDSFKLQVKNHVWEIDTWVSIQINTICHKNANPRDHLLTGDYHTPLIFNKYSICMFACNILTSLMVLYITSLYVHRGACVLWTLWDQPSVLIIKVTLLTKGLLLWDLVWDTGILIFQVCPHYQIPLYMLVVLTYIWIQMTPELWARMVVVLLQEFEEHEEERAKFMQGMLYKYINLHVGMHEKSAEVHWMILLLA